MSSQRSHYTILGLSHDASEAEIKRAFHKLSLKYHPDKAGEEYSDVYHRIQTAYNVLSDTRQRKMYDQNKNFESYDDSDNENFDPDDYERYSEGSNSDSEAEPELTYKFYQTNGTYYLVPSEFEISAETEVSEESLRVSAVYSISLNDLLEIDAPLGIKDNKGDYIQRFPLLYVTRMRLEKAKQQFLQAAA